MSVRPTIGISLLALLLSGRSGFCQQPSVPGPAIQGIQGVNQQPPASPGRIPPPVAEPPPAPEVRQVDGMTAARSVTAPPPATPQPQQPVAPPPSVQAAGSVRAVKGVPGIVAGKQRNLETVLLIKQANQTSNPKARATAAAALFRSKAGKPEAPQAEDSRAEFQEFARQTAPGS